MAIGPHAAAPQGVVLYGGPEPGTVMWDDEAAAAAAAMEKEKEAAAKAAEPKHEPEPKPHAPGHPPPRREA